MVNGLPSKQKLWVRFSLPVIKMHSTIKNISFKPKINFSAVNTATNRLNYLFRKGQKGTTETKMRERFKQRARKKATSNVAENANNIASRFKSFFISATPFIGLKTRRIRRGKRIRSKVIALTRIRCQRKSLTEFASSFYSVNRAKKPLISRLELELDNIYSNRHKRGTSSQGSSSSLYDKQALLYSTAYTARGSAIKKLKNKAKKKRQFLSSSGVEHMAVNH